VQAQWEEVIRDLCKLRAVTVELDGERSLLRTPVPRCVGRVFQAVGVRTPAVATPL